jgi:hypothetical protein
MADDDELNADDAVPFGDDAEDAIDAADDEEPLLAEGVGAESFADAAEGDAGPVAVDDEAGDADEESGSRRGRRATSAETMNEQARRSLRARLESDVEAFLRRGGKIEAVPMDVRADAPKKPESKYGSRSI